MYVRQIAYDQLSMRQWLTTMIAIGLAIGALVAAVGGYGYYERSRNARIWTEATATVSGIGELCHMSRKSGKRWAFVDAVECQNVDGYIAEHPDNKWKSTKVGYITFKYSANGEDRKQLAPHWRLSALPVTVGQQLPIFFNPDNTAEFDRPIADQDVADFMVTAYIGLAIVFGVALFGALLGWMSERKRRYEASANV